MVTPPSEFPVVDARSYSRAHAGKLMVVVHSDGRDPSPSDFFQIDLVHTHPTGLMVTAIFDDHRRSHLMATSVRVATKAEIASRQPANTQ